MGEPRRGSMSIMRQHDNHEAALHGRLPSPLTSAPPLLPPAPSPRHPWPHEVRPAGRQRAYAECQAAHHVQQGHTGDQQNVVGACMGEGEGGIKGGAAQKLVALTSPHEAPRSRGALRYLTFATNPDLPARGPVRV